MGQPCSGLALRSTVFSEKSPTFQNMLVDFEGFRICRGAGAADEKDVVRVRRDEVTADRVCTELVEIGVPPDPRRFLPPIEGTLNVRPKQGGISGAFVAHYPLLLER